MRRVTLSASLAVVVGFLSSCGGGGGGSSSTGKLTVSITAASPASASVKVTGPGGYQKVLTATETLTALAPGSYTVAATPSRVAGAVVSTVYDGAVTGSPATVANGATANASVTYALRGGTGRLWVTDRILQELEAYTAAQLAASGSPTPDVAIGTGATTQTYDVAVAPNGALWVSLPGTGSTHQIVRYDPSQLTASGTATPAATIAVDHQVDTLAFDASGNLWVDVAPFGSLTAPTVQRYDAAALVGAGTLPATPSLSWQLPGTGFTGKLAFDASGNLWVFDSGDNGTHEATNMRVDASTLGATGTPAFSPAATITSTHVFWQQGVAFDGDGNLWIAVLNNGGSPGANLVRYAKSQLAVSGTQVVDPEAIITVPGTGFLGSIAFDEAGDLWLADYSGRTISHLARSTIVASGSFTSTPDVVINTPVPAAPVTAGIVGLAFDPTPLGLPLQ